VIGLRGVCAVAWLVLAGNLALHADAQLPALNQRADSYRCPMHPEVSGPPGSQCSRCGMTLVVGSNADYTPYVVDLETVPRALKARESGRLRLWVREPATGSTVRQFDIVHERLFHLFVISGDLDYFAHVHPVLQPDGELEVPIELPRAGPYQLIGDFLPVGGRPQLVQRPLVTAGYRGPLAIVPALAPDLSVKVSEATRVELTPPDPRAGREQLLTFELSDAASGVPADDLQP
jgi:Heavy metal binding domain